jgi:multimeric flavodoxin WrbA
MNTDIKAIILLGTLKKEGLSNTQVLCEFFQEKLRERNIDSEIIKLVDYKILPGTMSNMGDGDEWPRILEKILSSQIIIFATPIWWGSHSSEIQRAIERLDEIHDGIMRGEKSPLEGKVGGIIITGDSDGTMHVIGNIGNYFNNIGLTLPPYSSLSILWEGLAKGAKTTREELMQKYREYNSKEAEKMIEGFLKYL